MPTAKGFLTMGLEEGTQGERRRWFRGGGFGRMVGSCVCGGVGGELCILLGEVRDWAADGTSADERWLIPVMLSLGSCPNC